MLNINADPQLMQSLKSLHSQGITFDIPEGVNITAEQHAGGIKIDRAGSEVKILYGKKAEFFKALGVLNQPDNNGDFQIELNARFDTLEAMLDISRASVFSVEGFKKTIKVFASLGYTGVQLYSEDTYEIPEEPYFGHMRGRLTAEEIRTMDSICQDLGIELIPCIQTLAHLEHIFKWQHFENVRDVDNVLLCGDEETYKLIDKMFKSVADSFTSRRINIGMDEAHLVGLGKYLDKNGYQDRFEILSKHLSRVLEIADKYGFKAAMWSDMFFRLLYEGRYTALPTDIDIADEAIAKVPKNVTLIYWDYYNDKKSDYALQIEKHSKFPNDITFAGGAWRWGMFAPGNEVGLKRAVTSLQACIEGGVKNVILTIWGDNGTECPLMATLPQVAAYSQMNYYGKCTKKLISNAMQGSAHAKYEDFMLLEHLNGDPKKYAMNSSSKYLLYNDPMAGLFDFYAYESHAPHYASLKRKYKGASRRNPGHEAMFESFEALAAMLEHKANLGNELISAYKAKDIEALRQLAKVKVPKIIKLLKKFISAFRRQWLQTNKPFGLELHSLRLGGLRQRLVDTQEMLLAFADGKIERLEELEQPRLSYIDASETKDEKNAIWAAVYYRIASANYIIFP